MSPTGLLSVRLATDTVLGVLVEGSLLLGATWGLVALLRGRRPAVRHTVWTAGFVLALLVPAAGALLPQRSLGVLHYPGTAAGSTPAGGISSGLAPADPFPGLPAGVPGGVPTAGPEAREAFRSARAPIPIPATGPGAAVLEGAGPGAAGTVWERIGAALVRGSFAVWGLGALALLARLVGHRLRVDRLTRRGSPVPAGDAPDRLVRREAHRMGIRRRVRVVYTPELPVPVTWGILRPVLLLPADAGSWRGARLRAVTVHELAHIRRWDALSQQLAELVRALYWANPLAWIARRLAAREREGACDDEVLRSGMAAPDYAGVLMEMARRAGGTPPELRQEVDGGLALAGPSRLEARVAAVLDGAPGGPRSGRGAALASCLALVVVAAPLAGTSLVAEGPASPLRVPSLATRIDAVRALGIECDEVSLWALTRTLEGDPAAAVRKAAALALGSHDDPRAVEVLAHAAADRHQDRAVRRAAMHTLGERDTREAAAALVERLGEGDPTLRGSAVRAMGRMNRQARRVRGPVAVVMLGDPDPSIRAAAARVLRRVGSDDSLPSLRQALKDPSAEVVRMARSTLEYLEPT